MTVGDVPDPRPGEYNDDGTPVDPGVCNPHHVIIETLRLLRAEGFSVSAHGAASGSDSLLGATLLISGLGLIPPVPGDAPRLDGSVPADDERVTRARALLSEMHQPIAMNMDDLRHLLARFQRAAAELLAVVDGGLS